MERRKFLRNVAVAAAGATAFLATGSCFAAAEKPSRLGLVTYCCRIRNSHRKKQNPSYSLFEPFAFLEHCHKLNAGGMQIDLGTMDVKKASELREQAAKFGMFVEAIVSIPKERKDIEKFEARLRTAANVGVAAARTTIIPGRRYEYFDSLETFHEFDARGRQALELAAPIAEKYKVPLAVENHKDHRNAERVALFEHISSAYVGACVDTGNSFALLEDPIETVKALAPWAHSVHLKDQAVQPYNDGFLLADIPLGQGCFDLKRMVAILREAKPKVNFSLELITRDPLQVPTHSKEYWATFPNLPAKDLARTLRMVRDRSSDNLQYVTRMSPQEQVAREDNNVKESLEYARRELGL